MKTITAPTPYGYHELRLFYQRYMTLAMLVAVTFQMTIIGGYHLAEWLKPPDDIVIPIRIRRTTDIPQPPSIKEGSQRVPAATVPGKMENAVPKPVDDRFADTAKTITPQDILSRQTDPNALLLVDGKFKIEIIEPPPDEKIVEYRFLEKEPMPISTPKPEYPDLALKANLEGNATVKVLLDKEGRVKETKLLRASEEIFAEPALDAAQKWVFTPALMNGNPVQVWVAIPFKFRLAH